MSYKLTEDKIEDRARKIITMANNYYFNATMKDGLLNYDKESDVNYRYKHGMFFIANMLFFRANELSDKNFNKDMIEGMKYALEEILGAKSDYDKR